MRDRTLFTTTFLVALSATGGTAQTDSLATEAVAKSFLSSLSGEWSFSLAGASDPQAWHGSRTYRLMHDSLHLIWDEVIGDSTDVGHGVLWYDPPSGRFFYFGLYAQSRTPMSLVGHLHNGALQFDPVQLPHPPFPKPGPLIGSVLQVNSRLSHTWSGTASGWVVQFDRQHGSRL